MVIINYMKYIGYFLCKIVTSNNILTVDLHKTGISRKIPDISLAYFSFRYHFFNQVISKPDGPTPIIFTVAP